MLGNKTAFREEIQDALQALDTQTLQHCIRVGNISREVEKFLNLPDNLLSSAAYVHDIGKIYIPQNILTKPNKLTSLERKIINLHPYYSYKILKSLNVDENICYIALYHHGKSAPTLDEIPRCEDIKLSEYARMLHTIDAYEALTAERPFRKKFNKDEALMIMNSEEGHQKDIMEFLHSIRI